jgi:ribosomal-protein-alanine N-acetyltransferase
MPGRKSKPKEFVLIGKRVFLRRPVMADLDEYTALRKLSARLFRGLVNPFNGKASFKRYIRHSRHEEYYPFLICLKDDRRIVGQINLFLVARGLFQSACVGYQVGVPYARQGYATEALQLVLRFAFKELKLHRVEANIQPGNKPSISLVKRAGFKLEGYSPQYLKICGKWRDHERWAILAEHWRKTTSGSRPGGPLKMP